MRRKVTLNLDEDWVAEIDRQRGLVPRSRYVEMISGISSSSLIVRPPAKDERSPEPQAGSEASQESPKGFWPPSEITAADLEAAEAERRARVKPPLPRPIIQKRGT